MKHRSWILVANGDKARVFKVERVGVLTELHDLIDPRGRMRESELVSDRPGRAHESLATARPAIEPRTTAHEKELGRFAKEIAQQLEQASQQHLYQHLYLVAEPRFLGYLRQALGPHANGKIAGQLAKDLVLEDPRQLWNHLPFSP